MDSQDKSVMQHFFLQLSLCITAIFVMTMLCMLVGQSEVLQAVGISSLGASCFIVFSVPKRKIAHTKTLVITYIAACLIGIVCHACVELATWYLSLEILWRAFFSALSVGASMGVMLISERIHPPAAGLALGLTFEFWEPLTLVCLFFLVALLVFMRWGLCRHLYDLL